SFRQRLGCAMYLIEPRHGAFLRYGPLMGWHLSRFSAGWTRSGNQCPLIQNIEGDGLAKSCCRRRAKPAIQLVAVVARQSFSVGFNKVSAGATKNTSHTAEIECPSRSEGHGERTADSRADWIKSSAEGVAASRCQVGALVGESGGGKS